MKVSEQLSKKLTDIGMGNFFYNISKELVENGLIVIEPHKKDGNVFYALLGIMGKKVEAEYTIDVISHKDFIEIATMELTIIGDSVSLSFSVKFDAIIGYITYPLLSDKSIDFVEAEVTAGFGAFLKLVKSMQRIRERIDHSINITKKRLRKSYLAKCEAMKTDFSDETIDIIKKRNRIGVALADDGWEFALELISKFIKELD